MFSSNVFILTRAVEYTYCVAQMLHVLGLLMSSTAVVSYHQGVDFCFLHPQALLYCLALKAIQTLIRPELGIFSCVLGWVSAVCSHHIKLELRRV